MVDSYYYYELIRPLNLILIFQISYFQVGTLASSNWRSTSSYRSIAPEIDQCYLYEEMKEYLP